MLEEAREISRKECDDWNWKYHLLPVAKNAKLLARKMNANEELVETAALLHDMGRIRFGEADHAATGATIGLRTFGHSKINQFAQKQSAKALILRSTRPAEARGKGGRA